MIILNSPTVLSRQKDPIYGVLLLMEVSEEFYIHNPEHSVKLIDSKYYQPVVVSNKEQIVDGDFYVSKGSSYIANDTIEWCHKFKYKKVLVMPQDISEKYIQLIVNGELKHGDEVLVSKREIVPEEKKTNKDRFIDNLVIHHDPTILQKLEWRRKNRWWIRPWQRIQIKYLILKDKIFG